MASLEDLYANIPTAKIAEQLGVDEDTARGAIQSVLPQLLGGLHEHAQDPEKEATLAAALDAPEAEAPGGNALVSTFFGGGNDQAAAALSSDKSGVDSGLVQKLLPILLPIVISYLGQKSSGKSGSEQSGSGGGALGDLIGGILSGAAGGQAGGALGSVLGSVLGGGSSPAPQEPAKPENDGGLFGKILGGFLNRKR